MQQIYNHCTRYNNISNIKCSKNTTDSIIVHATTTYLVQQATYAVDTINVHILPSCALHDSHDSSLCSHYLRCGCKSGNQNRRALER